jgi:hypothetical protein
MNNVREWEPIWRAQLPVVEVFDLAVNVDAACAAGVHGIHSRTPSRPSATWNQFSPPRRSQQ